MKNVSILYVAFFVFGCDSIVEKKEYYSNGSLKSIIEFKHGKRNGEAVYYDSIGEIIERSQFENDSLNGLSIVYNKNGSSVSRCYNNRIN